MALALQPLSASAETVRLAPSTNWEVNHDKDSCVLARIFGEGEDRTGLYFSRFEPGDEFRLTLVSDYVRAGHYGDEHGAMDVKIQFGPAEGAFRVRATAATTEADQKALIFSGHMTIAGAGESAEDEGKWLNADLADPYELPPERESAITELVFHSGLREELILETGSLGKPFAVLRDCNDWLLGQWGIDVEAHRHLTRRARPVSDPQKWLRSADYPKSMLSELRTGLVQFRLAIEPDGSISDCTIQQSTNPEDFSRTTCDLIKRRARFEPALDAAGQPIRSYWRGAVRWLL